MIQLETASGAGIKSFNNAIGKYVGIYAAVQNGKTFALASHLNTWIDDLTRLVSWPL